ncbi:MAG: hypothetical protein PUC15_07990 [Lentisphaeria bacterium]|nr:hypothetical protein [Lentisphaeria bacterium]
MKFKLSDMSAVLKFQKLPIDRLNFVKREVASEAYRKLGKRSPVLTGRYRAGFNVSINGIDYTAPNPAPSEYIKYRKEYYKFDESKGQKAFEGVTLQVTDEIFISNSLPYAIAIENGHSRKAPEGVFRTVIPEIKEDIKRFAGIAANKDGGLK